MTRGKTTNVAHRK